MLAHAFLQLRRFESDSSFEGWIVLASSNRYHTSRYCIFFKWKCSSIIDLLHVAHITAYAFSLDKHCPMDTENLMLQKYAFQSSQRRQTCHRFEKQQSQT